MLLVQQWMDGMAVLACNAVHAVLLAIRTVPPES